MSQTKLENTDDTENNSNIMVESPISSDIDRETLMELFIQKIDAELSAIFSSQEEIRVADAILTVFKKRENIEVFNKKALFVYVKEITDTNSNCITKVIKTLKRIYVELLNDRLENYDQ